jgi:Ni,Fe-hydrogenase III large subunit
MLMNSHDEVEKLLKQIQPHLTGLKEKVNDIGGEVTYDELENCETLIEFMNVVWGKKYDQLTDLVGGIIKYDSNKKQKNKSFKLLPAIDSVVKNIKNLKEEVANFLDSSRQTTRIIEEMVTKTKITFQMSEKNPDKIESVI